MLQSRGKASPKTSNKPSKRKQKTKVVKRRTPSKQNKLARSSTLAWTGHAPTVSYMKSLCDPFEHSGPRLGWGCMIPTQVVQAYLRSATTVNADGSLALAIYPNSTSMVTVANGGTAVSFATSAAKVSATDSAALAAQYVSGRIISGGIRAYPNIPMTSAPGSVSVGALPGLTFAQVEAQTPNDLIASPYARQFKSYAGGTSTNRPEDVDSFSFNTKCVGATVFSGSDDLPVSTPFVVFSGLPASTLVYYEAVLNIEVIAASLHSGTSIGIGDSTIGDTLASLWNSAEHMWSNVKGYLTPAGVYGAATALGTSINTLGAGAGNSARAIASSGPIIEEVFEIGSVAGLLL